LPAFTSCQAEEYNADYAPTYGIIGSTVYIRDYVDGFEVVYMCRVVQIAYNSEGLDYGFNARYMNFENLKRGFVSYSGSMSAGYVLQDIPIDFVGLVMITSG
jgi:hypothetical protein